ncbi:MAG: DUF3310 domain-containing protein [Turicibacter sp.]|nr:DUF3310 domain-containing protein [Turicibacter sp.]
MTKSFKETADEFKKLMREYNNKLVTTDGQILTDSDAEKCKANKDLSWYNKEIERIAKEVEKITKEISDNVAFELGKIESEDNIISPNHYASDKGFEVFDVQEAFIHELKGMAASYWCNVVKYILRFQRKNGVEDLKKAKYYLEKLIEEETDNE